MWYDDINLDELGELLNLWRNWYMSKKVLVVEDEESIVTLLKV